MGKKLVFVATCILSISSLSKWSSHYFHIMKYIKNYSSTSVQFMFFFPISTVCGLSFDRSPKFTSKLKINVNKGYINDLA